MRNEPKGISQNDFFLQSFILPPTCVESRHDGKLITCYHPVELHMLGSDLDLYYLSFCLLHVLNHGMMAS